MKKNKKSLKKLTLNKKVVSNLESQQTVGGTFISVVVCPIDTVFCPSNFCPSRLINCETQNIVECQTTTIRPTLVGPGCGGSVVDGCGSALGCTF
ncbi:MAG: hypothetical protein AB8B65_16925 [Kordia sp.]|uniref:hypothetical protein n=1 Tax=Kordia sp. TaxID=1965332 RepID=UPI003859EFDC